MDSDVLKCSDLLCSSLWAGIISHPISSIPEMRELAGIVEVMSYLGLGLSAWIRAVHQIES